MLKKLTPAWPILTLTIGHGAVDAFAGLLPAITPGIAKLMNVPIGHIVILGGIAALVNNTTQPLSGWIMQKYNLAGILWLAVLVSSLPTLMGIVPNFWWLCTIVIIGAIGTGAYHTEGMLSAHDATGEKAFLGVPLFMAGGVAIYSTMAPLSIWMSEQWGFQSLLWLIIPGLTASLLLLLLYKKKRREHPSVVIRPRSRRVTTVKGGNMSFWPLLAVGVCFCVASGLFVAIVTSHYELLFGENARHAAGYVLMVLGILTSAASFGWSWLSKRYDFYRLTLISQILATPLFLLMAHVPSPEWGVALSVPLALVTPGALHPVGIMLARNAAGLTQALRTGLLMGGAYGVSAIAVMVAGVLLDQGVGSDRLVAFCSLCSLCAVAIAIWKIVTDKKNLPKVNAI